MGPPSSPSSTITSPPDYHETARRLAKLIAEAMTCPIALLHYDSASKSMTEWCWIVSTFGELPFAWKPPPPPLEGSPPSSLGQPPFAQEEPVHNVLDLLTTPADIQEAFYKAFQTELDMQSELMLDLLILQAKMRRTETEITLYTLALENTHAFNFSDHSSQTFWDRSILRPILSNELHHCDVDADDDTDQLHHNDFEVW
ncbi:hypothetical protein DFJ58DRAFT_734530 [Suillus subalutaceus]|uniref:uncharacterized protein n=1 Tax=Suillus subalutaceus TaxID=48586 RepID=UPI001B87A1AA|nr:uncharacterized protein DFJ58DRAFT_734530 [Suillus subalutaceus]KAG1837176.1 hypothetical protein DFJ58DRAFT_734530 [Suillus subalutaceus]